MRKALSTGKLDCASAVMTVRSDRSCAPRVKLSGEVIVFRDVFLSISKGVRKVYT